VPRYRIRYRDTEVEIPVGEFIVGRSPSCHLALDDALVSRRHAVVHVQTDGAWIEDLESRNGVFVNGERVEGKRRLSHLDRVTIGTQELVFLELADHADRGGRCDGCGAALDPGTHSCNRCGRRIRHGSPTLTAMQLELPTEMIGPTAAQAGSDPSPTTRPPGIPPSAVPSFASASSAFHGVDSDEARESTGHERTRRALLTGLADKALALGRYESAERILAPVLEQLLTRARSTSPLDFAQIQEATRYALRLAEGTRRTAWLDYVFELHEASGRLMTGDEIDKLHEVVRQLRYRGIGRVRSYIDAIRGRASELGPAERFLLSRLESLERLVSA
jgi:hypothetical protein